MPIEEGIWQGSVDDTDNFNAFRCHQWIELIDLSDRKSEPRANEKEEYDPKIGIINFDAHFYLRPYPNGGNSGTMFRQIADQCKEKDEEGSIGYIY
ncbi:arginase family protein [Natroniella acetigena]|nr:arginase family protein [Natroniella acetigena]MCK8828275.1 arginase family protein [Natroniella acetigena]